MQYESNNGLHTLRQEEVDNFQKGLKEEMTAAMHELRLTQKLLAHVTGYNQSTIARILNPLDTHSVKVSFLYLLAGDIQTRELGRIALGYVAKELQLQTAPNADVKLNGSTDDEVLDITEALGKFIESVREHPGHRAANRLLLERIKQDAQNALAELDNLNGKK